MQRKMGAILLAVLLVVCCGAVGLANEGMFISVENFDEAGLEAIEEECDNEEEKVRLEAMGQDDGSDDENEEDGPPPWASEEALMRWEWRQANAEEDGPPPWASEEALMRWEWRQANAEEDGPPPWANGKDDNVDEEEGRGKEKDDRDRGKGDRGKEKGGRDKGNDD